MGWGCGATCGAGQGRLLRQHKGPLVCGHTQPASCPTTPSPSARAESLHPACYGKTVESVWRQPASGMPQKSNRQPGPPCPRPRCRLQCPWSQWPAGWRAACRCGPAQQAQQAQHVGAEGRGAASQHVAARAREDRAASGGAHQKWRTLARPGGKRAACGGAGCPCGLANCNKAEQKTLDCVCCRALRNASSVHWLESRSRGHTCTAAALQPPRT